MKTSVISLSLVTLFSAVSVTAADDLPKRFNFDRYNAMLNRSPFAVATAVATQAATPNFAKDLYVANAARTNDGDLVTIASSGDKSLKEYLSTKGPNEHGYAISNIQWSERPGETKVTISKDGQFATLSFNQALMTSGPAPNMPNPPNASGQPGYVPPTAPTPVAPAYVPPKPAPGIPTPPPHTRGMIQRNPGVVTPIPTPISNPQPPVEE